MVRETLLNSTQLFSCLFGVDRNCAFLRPFYVLSVCLVQSLWLQVLGDGSAKLMCSSFIGVIIFNNKQRPSASQGPIVIICKSSSREIAKSFQFHSVSRCNRSPKWKALQVACDRDNRGCPWKSYRSGHHLVCGTETRKLLLDETIGELHNGKAREGRSGLQ